VDWPYVSNAVGTAWMRNFDMAPEDKARIMGGNATALLRL
jgi:predicted TIM-barrel fold metal-dependent hydrolase